LSNRKLGDLSLLLLSTTSIVQLNNHCQDRRSLKCSLDNWIVLNCCWCRCHLLPKGSVGVSCCCQWFIAIFSDSDK